MCNWTRWPSTDDKFLKVTDLEIWKNKIETIQCQEIYSDVILYLADGLQMAHIRPPHSHYRYISTFPTMAARLASQQGWNQRYMSVFRMWLGFMLLFSANCLPAKSFLRGPQRWKLLDPIIPPWLVSAYSWEMKTTLPTVLISCPVTSIYLDPLRNDWLASDLQQTLLRSKLYLLATDISNQLMTYWDKSLGPWWDKYLNVDVDCVVVWRVPSVTRCHVYIKVGIKFLASHNLLQYFFETCDRTNVDAATFI